MSGDECSDLATGGLRHVANVQPEHDLATGKELGEQAQPQPFGFPPAGGVPGQGEHLQPGSDLAGQGDSSRSSGTEQ
jgi:hypothetical protein